MFPRPIVQMRRIGRPSYLGMIILLQLHNLYWRLNSVRHWLLYLVFKVIWYLILFIHKVTNNLVLLQVLNYDWWKISQGQVQGHCLIYTDITIFLIRLLILFNLDVHLYNLCLLWNYVDVMIYKIGVDLVIMHLGVTRSRHMDIMCCFAS